MGFLRKLFGVKEPIVLRPAPAVITEEHVVSVIERMQVYLRDHGATQPARLMFIKQASSKWEEIDSLSGVAISFVIEGLTLQYIEMDVLRDWYITLNGQIVVSKNIVGSEAPAADPVVR